MCVCVVCVWWWCVCVGCVGSCMVGVSLCVYACVCARVHVCLAGTCMWCGNMRVVCGCLHVLRQTWSKDFPTPLFLEARFLAPGSEVSAEADVAHLPSVGPGGPGGEEARSRLSFHALSSPFPKNFPNLLPSSGQSPGDPHSQLTALRVPSPSRVRARPHPAQPFPTAPLPPHRRERSLITEQTLGKEVAPGGAGGVSAPRLMRRCPAADGGRLCDQSCEGCRFSTQSRATASFFSLFNLPTPGEKEFWSLLTCCTNLDIPFGGTGIRDPFECLFCI